MIEFPPWLRLVWYACFAVVLISGAYGLTIRHQLVGAVMILMSVLGFWTLAIGDDDE